MQTSNFPLACNSTKTHILVLSDCSTDRIITLNYKSFNLVMLCIILYIFKISDSNLT